MLSVRLPRTETRRGAHSHLILIDRVSLDPYIPSMLAWQGTHYRTGALIEASKLREGSLVLETTQALDSNVTAARRYWRLMLILWRYSRTTAEPWTELSRMMAPSSYASFEMRQLAARMLDQDFWRDNETIDDAAERICASVDKELRLLRRRDRTEVTDRLLHLIVSRLVEERGELELEKYKPQIKSEGLRIHTHKVRI